MNFDNLFYDKHDKLFMHIIAKNIIKYIYFVYICILFYKYYEIQMLVYLRHVTNVNLTYYSLSILHNHT